MTGTANRSPTVVGLDLSIAATGICGIDGQCRTVAGPSKLGDQRLGRIVGAVLNECAPLDLGDDGEAFETPVDLVVIEDLPTHAQGAGVTGMVHGAVRYALIGHRVTYVLVPPATLKKFATGKGNCGKPEMAVAAYKRAGLEFTDDNQCDAWWLRAAGLDALGHPLFDMPAAQREALSKVAWPALQSDIERTS